MAKVSRYKLRDSDRSGFKCKEIALVKDDGFLVSPDEKDTPPPSSKPLGGEGEVSRGDMRDVYLGTVGETAAPTSSIRPVYILDISDSIPYVSDETWLQVAGTSATVNLTSNPQMRAGQQGKLVAIECVSNQLVLEDGNGLSMPSTYNMNSGAIWVAVYDTGNNVWQEASRSNRNLTA